MEHPIGKVIASLSVSDYIYILLATSSAFMGISLILRVCCVHKKAIDFTLISVICLLVAMVIKLFYLEASLSCVVIVTLLLVSVIFSGYILIDNAAASLSIYDRPKDRVKNAFWCIGYYIIITILFLL